MANFHIVEAVVTSSVKMVIYLYNLQCPLCKCFKIHYAPINCLKYFVVSSFIPIGGIVNVHVVI